MSTRYSIYFLLILLFSLVALPAGAQNLIVNGSFEQPAIAAQSSALFNAIPGWAAESGLGIEIQRSAYTGDIAYKGSQNIEIAGGGSESFIRFNTNLNPDPNEGGLIDGVSLTPAAPPRNYVIDSVGGYNAFGLNDYGDVCGFDNSSPAPGIILPFGQQQVISMQAPGSNRTFVVGINDSDDAAVRSLPTATTTAPFVYANGSLSALPFVNEGDAHGINNAGQVVGMSNNQAVIWHSGKITVLGNPANVQYSEGDAINAAGQVTGYAEGNGTLWIHAFLWSSKFGMQDLGTPWPDANAPSGFDGTSYGYAINTNEEVVGSATNDNTIYHAFVYANGAMTDIGTLPSDVSAEALGVNDAGQVVGYSDYEVVGPPGRHAFLWQNGAMLDLNALVPGGINGFDQDTAIAINNRGQIVVQDYGGADWVLLTPQAEEVSASMGVSLSGLTYDSQTQVYSGQITLTNTGKQPILGPLQLELTNLTTGAALINQTGTYNGDPYLYFNRVIQLKPGKSVIVPVQFTYSGTGSISYGVRTYSGSFGS